MISLPFFSLRRLACASSMLLALAALPAHADDAAADQRPLSLAQITLFMTPHMKNVEHPETLQYRFTREGPGAFTDTVAEHILTVHPNGTKSVAFDFLTGERRKSFPGVDEFSGNPMLMVFLENDVNGMKEALGVSAAYFRDRFREAMVDRATVTDTTFELDGKPVAAKEVAVKPYATEDRLERLPSVQAKLYRFVFSGAVPGGLAEISAEMPADPAHDIPAASERIVFTGVTP
jgi:hypothetical protein